MDACNKVYIQVITAHLVKIMENLGEYNTSKRGNRTLLHHGHEFWFHRELKNRSRVWCCMKNRSCKCKATIVTRDLVSC